MSITDKFGKPYFTKDVEMEQASFPTLSGKEIRFPNMRWGWEVTVDIKGEKPMYLGNREGEDFETQDEAHEHMKDFSADLLNTLCKQLGLPVIRSDIIKEV